MEKNKEIGGGNLMVCLTIEMAKFDIEEFFDR